jgi:hypothetical protein
MERVTSPSPPSTTKPHLAVVDLQKNHPLFQAYYSATGDADCGGFGFASYVGNLPQVANAPILEQTATFLRILRDVKRHQSALEVNNG